MTENILDYPVFSDLFRIFILLIITCELIFLKKIIDNKNKKNRANLNKKTWTLSKKRNTLSEKSCSSKGATLTRLEMNIRR